MRVLCLSMSDVLVIVVEMVHIMHSYFREVGGHDGG